MNHNNRTTPQSNYNRLCIHKIEDQSEYNHIKEALLTMSPQILRKLQLLNKKLEEAEVLEFVEREQHIMNSELIQQRIPQIVANIQSLQETKRKSTRKIEESQLEIERLNQKITSTKAKIQKKYIQLRQNKQKESILIESIENLRESQKNRPNSSFKRDSMNILENILKKKVSISQNCNKQNYMNSNNKDKGIQSCTEPCSFVQYNPYSTEILKGVTLKTNNQMMANKMQDLKAQIKYKMQLLEEKKKERKRITQELGSKPKYHKNTNSSTIKKSEYNTIMKSDRSPSIEQSNSMKREIQFKRQDEC